MRPKLPSRFPDSDSRRTLHAASGAPCPACAEGDDGDRAIAQLVRVAYRDSRIPEIPGELLERILAAREDTMSDLVSVLAGLAASPLIALSLGL